MLSKTPKYIHCIYIEREKKPQNTFDVLRSIIITKIAQYKHSIYIKRDKKYHTVQVWRLEIYHYMESGVALLIL